MERQDCTHGLYLNVNTISHNSKNRFRKDRKIDFLFNSALWASFMKIGAILRGGGVFAYP